MYTCFLKSGNFFSHIDNERRYAPKRKRLLNFKERLIVIVVASVSLVSCESFRRMIEKRCSRRHERESTFEYLHTYSLSISTKRFIPNDRMVKTITIFTLDGFFFRRFDCTAYVDKLKVIRHRQKLKGK